MIAVVTIYKLKTTKEQKQRKKSKLLQDFKIL